MKTELVTKEKQAELESLGRDLARKVRMFFTNAENRERFSTWYQEKYGKAYRWSKL